jgi:hypothetical protein
MAQTSGLSATATTGIAQQVLDALTRGTVAAPLTVAVPLRVLFMSVIRTTNTGTDTEFPASAGYTQGTGFNSAITWNAITTSGTVGATVTNSTAIVINTAPSTAWQGNLIRDASATPKELWYAPLTGGQKTVNAGDTCTIPSASLTLNLG